MNTYGKLQQCKGLLSCISPDAWLQTIGNMIGAAIGAFLGGFGAYLIYKKEINDRRRDIKNNFKKIFRKKNEWIYACITSTKLFMQLFENQSENLPAIKALSKTLGKARDSLLEIPDEKIPDDIFELFFALQDEIAVLKTFIDLYYEHRKNDLPYVWDSNDIGECLKKIKSLQKRINEKL